MQLAFRYSMCLLIFLFFADPAFASTDGHPLPWANFIYRIITLALFLGIIVYFFGNKIKAFFQGRSRQISEDLQTLESKKAEALAQLTELEKRISHLEEERLAILEEYTRQGEALRNEILEQAEQAAKQIAQRAEQSAQNEIDRAVNELRANLAEKICHTAERLIQEQLTVKEQVETIHKHITKVVSN